MTLVPTRWWASLFMPSCLLLVALAIGIAWCLWAWRRGRTVRQARLPVAWTIGSLLLLYLASTPALARWATWTLERQHPPVAVERLPAADAIVVLGGAMHAMRRPDGSLYLFSRGASDRFEAGLAAFQAGRAPVIVFGGGETGVDGAPTEGEWNRQRAVARGVPEAAAVAAGRALYTSDESALVAEQLRARGAQTVILCSSATHLPRAAGHYRRLGFQVTVLPSDFATQGEAERWSWALMIPRARALAQVDDVAKEWMGWAAGG